MTKVQHGSTMCNMVLCPTYIISNICIMMNRGLMDYHIFFVTALSSECKQGQQTLVMEGYVCAENVNRFILSLGLIAKIQNVSFFYKNSKK